MVDEKNRRPFHIKFAIVLAIASAGMYVSVMLKTAGYF